MINLQTERANNMDVSKKAKEYFGSALAVYLVMLAIYYFGVKNYFSGEAGTYAKCGAFGDMFGGFNAIFAGLGFIAVAITTYLQIEQYKEDKEKSHRYQVENTFFNMLDTLREIVSNTYLEDDSEEKGKQYSGIIYLKHAIKLLRIRYKKHLYEKQKEIATNDKIWNETYKFIDHIPVDGETRKALVVKAYEEFYEDHEHNLGHYFRYLYNIFKFVLNSFKDNPDIARQYIGLIQAQMSNDELGLTFYNALSKHSKNLQQEAVFHRWLDDFDIFENIDPRCVFDDIFLEFYPQTHFKYKLRQEMVPRTPNIQPES